MINSLVLVLTTIVVSNKFFSEKKHERIKKYFLDQGLDTLSNSLQNAYKFFSVLSLFLEAKAYEMRNKSKNYTNIPSYLSHTLELDMMDVKHFRFLNIIKDENLKDQVSGNLSKLFLYVSMVGQHEIHQLENNKISLDPDELISQACLYDDLASDLGMMTTTIDEISLRIIEMKIKSTQELLKDDILQKLLLKLNKTLIKISVLQEENKLENYSR